MHEDGGAAPIPARAHLRETHRAMGYDTPNIVRGALLVVLDRLDDDLSIPALAAAVGVSASTLKRAFRVVTGQGAGEVIRRLRLEHGLRALRETDITVLEAALMSGFEDPSAFTRSFKRVFGLPPTTARGWQSVVPRLESMSLEPPVVRAQPALPFQVITETGHYFDAAPRAWERVGAAVAAQPGGSPAPEVFVAVSHDNPHEGPVPAGETRFSAGILGSAPRPGFTPAEIPAGSWLSFRHRGPPWTLGRAHHHIFGAWRERSGAELDPEVPPHMLFSALPEPGRAGEARILVRLKESP